MPEPDKILRMRTVLARTGLSRSTIYRKMKDGTFPSQVHISEHCCGWRESTINCWMEDPQNYRAGEQLQATRSAQLGAPPNVTRQGDVS
jgi:prophage regulatory protein